MKEHTIKLDGPTKISVMQIYSIGVLQASNDIRRILSLKPGRALFTWVYNIKMTLSMAVNRRRFCMKKFNQARRGFIT